VAITEKRKRSFGDSLGSNESEKKRRTNMNKEVHIRTKKKEKEVLKRKLKFVVLLK